METREGKTSSIGDLDKKKKKRKRRMARKGEGVVT